MFKETNNNTNIYAWNCCFCFTVTQLCLTLVTSWTVALQSLLSMGFPRQEYWKWAAISSSRGSSWFRDQTCVSCISRRILYLWATREPENLPELHWKNREQFCFKVLENEILFDSEDVHNFFQITNFLFRCVQPAAKYNHYFCCFGSCIFFILEVHFFFKYACYFVEFPIPCVGFPCGSVVKNLPANAGDLGSIPNLGKSHMP